MAMKVLLVLEVSDPPTDADDWERLVDEMQGAASSVLCDINRGDSGDVRLTIDGPMG